MGIKTFLIGFMMLVALTIANAQNKTILITESALPYSSQTWFYSGAGNALQESSIKENWNKGKRITSAAFTDHGWFVTMANDTGIGLQAYNLSSAWPTDWIREKWNNDYYISSISRSESNWLVVMSQGTGYSAQVYNREEPDWDRLSAWIKEKWNGGFYVTGASYNGSYWTVVMSKHPQYTSQGIIWATSYSELQSKIKTDIWDKGKNVQLIEFGDGEYFIVYCTYKENNDRGQTWQVNPTDIREYIKKRWDASDNIAYVGSGYPASSGSSSSYVSSASQPRPSSPSPSGQTWREELGYGLFAITRGDPNGARIRTIYRACPGCHGTVTCRNCHGMRKCPICAGNGGIITAGYGNYLPCAACGATGWCGICKGTGKCICASYEYPGYVPGSTLAIGANGEVIYNSSGYESTSPSSTGTPSSGRSGSGTCPRCHGRKYESTAYSYAAASASGVIPPYHHSGGSGCPHCSNTTDHYHYPCPGCMGKGRQ